MAEYDLQANHLSGNILAFSRLLRAAGLPVGPGSVIDAQQAVATLGLESREDFYQCLFAVFVNRVEQREIFDQAFHIFWKNPAFRERLLNAMLPTVSVPEQESDELLRRVGEAFAGAPESEANSPDETHIEFDASLTFSDRELLQQKDFEQMSAVELTEAKKEISRLRLPVMDMPTRRYRPHPAGQQLDMRATLRASLRNSDLIPLQYKKIRTRPPALVVLCDISGSMSQYSRMFLHFMYAVTNDRDRVHSFVFGTRLTNITRYLRSRDVDKALESTTHAVKDWSGGTRIGSCLGDFNRRWSRRVLGQGAVTLIISDGLDRDAGEGLKQEMDRLNKSSRQLIWLNPLLRYENFEPRAQGIKSMLPYVDHFLSGHNIRSLQNLVDVLSERKPRLGQAA